MALVRVMSTPGDPTVGVFYCRDCDVTEIQDLMLDSSDPVTPPNP